MQYLLQFTADENSRNTVKLQPPNSSQEIQVTAKTNTKSVMLGDAVLAVLGASVLVGGHATDVRTQVSMDDDETFLLSPA